MKRIAFLFQVIIGLTCLSCSNIIEVETPTFDVQLEKTTFQVNDTVKFNFIGVADYIMFYSGESGSEYAHRLRTKVSNARPILNFDSEYKFGPPVRNFKLYVLTDFSGVMNAENISAATKHDISEQAVFTAAPGRAGVWTNSGDVDLSEFSQYPQINLAFQFVSEEMGTGNQGTLTIQNLSLTTYDENNNSYPILRNLSDGGWLAFGYSGPARNWRIRAQDLFLGVNPREAANDDWVITKALDLSSILPDKGTSVKTLTSQAQSFEHIFKEAGEYLVTFVAKNENVYDGKEVIKQIKIVIQD